MGTKESFAELISMAEKHFEKAAYPAAESILNQLILQGCKDARVFHMLGTIFYDKSQFTKSVRSFRRALEIDPTFTDASIGLSILLNDLGRYEEGKKVFETANKALAKNTFETDPFLKSKISSKHEELGDLYLQTQQFSDATEQYFKSVALTQKNEKLHLKIINCYQQAGKNQNALKHINKTLADNPTYNEVRLKLAQINIQDKHYQSARKAIDSVLSSNPEHTEAQVLLGTIDNANKITYSVDL